MQTKVLPLSLRASGWLLSNLGRPFPGMTARIFLRLYMTPPKRKINAAQLETRSKATVQPITLSQYPFDPTPILINTYRWGKPGKKILVLHGWGDTGLSFGPLVDTLVAAGYEVIAYDAPAHGYSGGKRTNLPQLMHILDQFLRLEGDIYGIVAHSMGALNAALTLARKENVIQKLVLVSPSLSAPAFFNDAFEIFNIRPEVATRTYGLIRTRLKEDLQTLDLHRYINQIRAEQILLVYDEHDQMVKYTDIESFLQQYSPIQSFRIKGQGHFRIMKNPLVISRIADFLN